MSISGYCKTFMCAHYGFDNLAGYCRPCHEKHQATELADPKLQVRTQLVPIPTKVDPVVEANRKMLHDRSQVGITKYGTTLGDAKLTHRQILQHALEEALDLANYLQTEIMKIDAEAADHKNIK